MAGRRSLVAKGILFAEVGIDRSTETARDSFADRTWSNSPPALVFRPLKSLSKYECFLPIHELLMKQPVLITVAAVILIVYDLTADVPEWIRELWLTVAIAVPVFVWAIWWMRRRG